MVNNQIIETQILSFKFYVSSCKNMSRRFRRILFYFFVAVFLLTAPVIILYAYGYKYDFERNKFIETGAIYVKSKPRKANIYINNKLNAKSSSVLVKGLIPHQYLLRIERDGFSSWSKNLEVYPGLVTKVESIILFPLILESALLNEQPIQNFYISHDKERIIFTPAPKPETEANENNGIWLQELEKNSAAIQLFKNETNAYENIQWSENSKYFVFYTKNRWLLIDIQKPAEIIDITQILGSETSNIQWSTKDSDTLYFLRNTQLFQFQWRSKTSNAIAENVTNYYIQNNQIYLTTSPNNFIYKIGLNGENRQQVTFGYPENVTIQKIQVSGNGTMIIFDSNSTLYLVENGLLKLLANKIQTAEFSADSKKLLLQTEHEVFVYFLDDIEGAPNRKKGEQIVIARYSEPIKKAVFLPFEYEHVFFEVNGALKISETDNRDQINTINLVQGNNFEISFDNNILNIYYITDKGLNTAKVDFNY